MSTKGVLAFVAFLASTAGPACLLTVSTKGLSEDDPADAAPPPVEATAPNDTGSDARDAAIDARIIPAGAKTWGGNGHAYFIVHVPEGIAWDVARDRAVQAGGHLATLGTAEENAFVKGLVQGADDSVFDSYDVGPWLGAYQPEPGGSDEPAGGWTWIDATPWSFTDWAPKQPDDLNGYENCLVWYRGDGLGWNDEARPGTLGAPVSYLVEFE